MLKASRSLSCVHVKIKGSDADHNGSPVAPALNANDLEAVTRARVHDSSTGKPDQANLERLKCQAIDTRHPWRLPILRGEDNRDEWINTESTI